MIPFELVDIFICLQLPETRQDGLKALAAHVQAKDAYLFGKDQELSIYLPAQGLPQTMRHAACWHALFEQCEAGTCVSARLPSPNNGEEIHCSVVVEKLGLSILVLLGVELESSIATQLQALLPLVAAKLTVERAAASAAGHAAAAREASSQARSLNAALDTNRRELQKAFGLLEKELAVRREAEQKLRETDRKKDDFLAMLAHELRNPLAPINMAAQLIKLPSSAPRQIEQASQIITRQVAHMTSLLDDLLDVSRVTRGKIVLEKEPVDIKAVIADAIEQSKPIVQLKQHQLDVHLTGQTVYVDGDKTRLVQIIANILINAGKYTPSQGILKLRVDATEEEVLIQISDNGIGIEAELLPHIFELFTQAPRSSDRSQGGLGIGLALVKSLVELHRGSISAHSQGINLGSEFTVRFPRYKHPLHVSASNVKNQPLVSERALSILVVDDNVDAASMLAAFMESLGHRVLTGHSAKEAMELAASQGFNVLFLDIGLPDMDGYELAQKIRGIKTCEDAVLVALTGYGQPQDKELAYEAGFDVHLTKPADFTSLMKILSDATAHRRGSASMDPVKT
jgi:signal transduction histidine kinase/ActR/RegA family two-component response regulator